MRSTVGDNPFIVIWELTQACGLKCVHCRAEAKMERDHNELNFEEGKKLIHQIKEMGNPMLIFTGGDVLMRPDFFDLADYAIKNGMRVSMTPSATPNVTKDAMMKAKEIGIPRWAFSLDGHTAEIHDSFRGVPGSFDLTIKALKYLEELHMPIQINTVISRYNYESIKQMADFVQNFNLSLWNVFMLVPTGRGQKKDSINALEYEKLFQWLYELGKRVPFDIKTTSGQHFRRVVIQNKMRDQQIADSAIEFKDSLLKGLMGVKDKMGRAPFGVNDGKGMLFISHTGDVFPSGMLPIKAGNVRKESLTSIYRNTPIFMQLKNPDLLKGKCGICEYKHVCGGNRARAFAITGDYLESEPYCMYIPEEMRKRKVN